MARIEINGHVFEGTTVVVSNNKIAIDGVQKNVDISKPAEQTSRFNSFDSFKSAVVAEVKKTYGKEKWFRGVCTDDLDQYYPHRFEDAVTLAETNTFFFDGY